MGNSSPKIDRVLFDLDGVLIDSASLHHQAWIEASHVFFKTPLSDPFLASLKGRGTRAIAQIIATHFKDPSVAPQLAKLKTKYVMDLIPSLRPMPGAHEWIETLKKKGIPFGIGTNSLSPFAFAAAEKMGWVPIPIVASDHVLAPKPAPDIYSALLRLLGSTTPLTGLVIDDQPHGIQAGQKAGMQTLMVGHKNATYPHLEAAFEVLYALPHFKATDS